MTESRTIDEILGTIAKEKLHIDTLETRNGDALDFHEVAVWAVRDALLVAYRAGEASAPGTPATDTKA